MAPHLMQILPHMWNTLTQSADRYVRTVVNYTDDADDPVDSDGELILQLMKNNYCAERKSVCATLHLLTITTFSFLVFQEKCWDLRILFSVFLSLSMDL